MYLNPTHRPLRVRGAGMIEVMLAMLLFSLALLGVAGAQLQALRLSNEASQLMLAGMLATDLLQLGGDNPAAAAVFARQELGGIELTSPVNCRAVDCAPRQLAEFDLAEWVARLRGTVVNAGGESRGGGLASGRACARLDGNQMGLTIAWHSGDPLPGGDSGCGRGLFGAGDGARQLLQFGRGVAP